MRPLKIGRALDGRHTYVPNQISYKPSSYGWFDFRKGSAWTYAERFEELNARNWEVRFCSTWKIALRRKDSKLFSLRAWALWFRKSLTIGRSAFESSLSTEILSVKEFPWISMLGEETGRMVWESALAVGSAKSGAAAKKLTNTTPTNISTFRFIFSSPFLRSSTWTWKRQKRSETVVRRMFMSTSLGRFLLSDKRISKRRPNTSSFKRLATQPPSPSGDRDCGFASPDYSDFAFFRSSKSLELSMNCCG